MKRKIYRFLSTERWSDSAVFFMRIFVGVLMLIHGIGKINNYEMLFATFPDPLGIGSATSLGLMIGAETLCSLLLIVGLFVRPAAAVLAVGMFVASFLAVPGEPFAAHELAFVYMGIYVMLFIAGGMRYSLDRIFFRIR
jgi:putative oxidoreductase